MTQIKKVVKWIGLTEKREEEPEKWIQRSITEYDEKGNITLDIIFDQNSHVEEKTISTYDENGQLLERTSYLSEDEIGERVKFSYNADQKLVGEEITYADGSVSFKTYQKNNKVIEAIIKDEDGDFEGREIYQYNEKDLLEEKVTYDEDALIEERIINQFDENQLLTQQIIYGRADEFVSRKIYKYDQKQNPVEIISTSEKGEIISHHKLFYNEFGNIVEQNINGIKIRNIYNDKQQIEKEETYAENGNIEAFKENSYDDEGNLIEFISFHSSDQYSTEPGLISYSVGSYIKGRFDITYYT